MSVWCGMQRRRFLMEGLTLVPTRNTVVAGVAVLVGCAAVVGFYYPMPMVRFIAGSGQKEVTFFVTLPTEMLALRFRYAIALAVAVASAPVAALLSCCSSLRRSLLLRTCLFYVLALLAACAAALYYRSRVAEAARLMSDLTDGAVWLRIGSLPVARVPLIGGIVTLAVGVLLCAISLPRSGPGGEPPR